MGRSGRAAVLTILAALLLALGLGGWLVATPSGLAAALALAGWLLPGELTWGEARGRLLGPLTLEQLHYRDGLQTLTAGHLAGDWTPAALARGLLRLERLEVEDLTLVLPDSPDGETDPFTLPELHLPLALEVWQADLERLRLQRGGDSWTLDRITLAATTREGQVRLESLTVAGPALTLEAQGRLTPGGDYPLALDLAWQLSADTDLQLAGRGRLTGTLAGTLELHHRLEGAAAAELDLQIGNLLSRPAWSGGLTVEALDLGLFAESLTGSQLAGRLNAWGSLEHHRLEGALTATAGPLPLTLALEARGHPGALEVGSLVLEGGENRLEVRGRLDYPTRAFDLQGQWSRPLAWPPTGEARFTSDAGRFRLRGTLTDLLARF